MISLLRASAPGARLRMITTTLFLFLFLSCSVPEVRRAPEKASPDAHKILQSAQQDRKQGRFKEALSKSETLVKSFASTDVVDDAWFLVGDIYFENRNYDRAVMAFMKIIDSGYETPLLGESFQKASQSLWRLGKLDDVIKLTARALDADLSSSEMIAIYDLRLQALERKGEYLEVLHSLVYLASNHPDNKLQNRYRQQALELVEGKLDKERLDKVSRDGSYGFVRPYSLFRKAELQTDDREYEEAIRSYRGVVELIPESDLAKQAQIKIAQLNSIREVDAQTIGVILPISGKNAPIAQKVLNGIQMGLGLHNKDSKIKLAIADSGGHPDIAREAVERLVREDNVVAIIGGLLSRTSDAIAEKAQQLEVPDISLSQKSGIPDIGNYVFRNSLTGQQQVRQLVRSAMDDLGIRRFAILYPNDPYGSEFANLFWDEVLARGGEIKGAQVYSPKETDFKEQVQRLVGTFYVSDREDEYKLRMKKWSDSQRRSARSEPPEDILPPIVDFEAIFIPDSARAVGQIAPMLLYNNVKGVRLMGTNLWNTPDLVRRGKNFVNNSIFVDTILPNDPRLQGTEFSKEFRQVFNEEPGIFEIQGYDSGLMLRQILASGADTRREVAESLRGMDGFPGALGKLSVQPNGEIDRPLMTLTIENQKVIPFSQRTKKK